MEIFNKKLKAVLLLIAMVAFTVPTFGTSLTANAGADQTLNIRTSNVTVTFNGTASTVDLNGTIVKYEWFYNEENLGTGATLDIDSVPLGSYIVTLIVTDNLGNTSSDTINVEVLPVLVANAGTDINMTLTSSNSILRLDGTASTVDSNGTIVQYEWFYNEESLGTGVTLDVESVPPGSYIVTLIVTDNLGNTASDTVNVEVLSSPNPVILYPLKQTGQTISWYPKDDGDYQKGVAPNYERDDAEEIVLDHVTKLQWQDNREAKTSQGTWQEAKNYCNNLNFGGHSDWRLPTRKELRDIVDRSRSYPSIDPTFENTNSSSSYSYWSSTSYVRYSSHAWIVGFYYGLQFDNLKTVKYSVRCVRAGE